MHDYIRAREKIYIKERQITDSLQVKMAMITRKQVEILSYASFDRRDFRYSQRTVIMEKIIDQQLLVDSENEGAYVSM